jgi:hypothetical protein
MTLGRRKLPEHEYGADRLVFRFGGTPLASHFWESRREDDGLHTTVVTGFAVWDTSTGRERHCILGAETLYRPPLTAISLTAGGYW